MNLIHENLSNCQPVAGETYLSHCRVGSGYSCKIPGYVTACLDLGPMPPNADYFDHEPVVHTAGLMPSAICDSIVAIEISLKTVWQMIKADSGPKLLASYSSPLSLKEAFLRAK